MNNTITSHVQARMQARGLPTEGITAFTPAAQPSQPAEATPQTPSMPWLKSEQRPYGYSPSEGEGLPLMANPAVFVPLNQLKTVAGRASLGAYDPGQAFNKGAQAINMVHNDLQELKTISGRPMKGSLDVIAKMIPEQGVFVSSAENYDKLLGIADDVLQQLQQDQGVAWDPTYNKSVRTKAQERLAVEARILGRITGSKDPREWERFGDKKAGSVGPPPDAIKALKDGTGTDAQFDSIFGKGAAAKARAEP